MEIFRNEHCRFSRRMPDGSNHSGAQLPWFLAYLMKCAITKNHTRFWLQREQVRDNILATTLLICSGSFTKIPSGEVYNAGGGRFSNCSMLEAIKLCEEISGAQMNYSYKDENRIGDHIWWISDVSKFKKHYPGWTWQYDLKTTLTEMYENLSSRI